MALKIPVSERVDCQTAVKLVLDEIARSVEKYGEFHSPHEAYGVLCEELDELFDEIRAKNAYGKEAVEEAAQVAAMAVHYIMTFGSKKDFEG
jgi:NTP pyrophosphatase (non-canonical NTP hydrolase)